MCARADELSLSLHIPHDPGGERRSEATRHSGQPYACEGVLGPVRAVACSEQSLSQA